MSHEWTDYSQVQDLYADGHEMASHTVSHSDGKGKQNKSQYHLMIGHSKSCWFSGFDEGKWADELIGMAEMLVRYAGVKPEDIKGMRAPFLQIGGDKMFSTLKRYGLYYDSSMSTSSPSWPYSLEYKIPHSCAVPPCPKNSHPGKYKQIAVNLFWFRFTIIIFTFNYSVLIKLKISFKTNL